MKLFKKALLVMTSSLMLTTSAMAGEPQIDNLLSHLINSAVESTTSQLSEALTNTLEDIQLFEAAENQATQTVQTQSEENLPVGTTAAE